MVHTKEIQAALAFIEGNLCEDLSLESVAKSVGLSKFYFHRTFQKETGVPLYAYIKRRRLAGAAALLLTTGMPILDIAVAFQFESQEAFTRAFKSSYQVPPGRYRTALKNLLIGESSMNTKPIINGWMFASTVQDKYRLVMDHAIFNTGTQSASIQSTADEYDAGDYATILQQFSTKHYIGKRVRLSGFIRTHEVSGWCGLWLRIDSTMGATLKIDNMQDRPISGTTEWNHYACVLDVPENGGIISIGMLLYGPGQAWLDNVSFQEVDRSIPATDFTPSEVYPEHPVNLTFEE